MSKFKVPRSDTSKDIKLSWCAWVCGPVPGPFGMILRQDSLLEELVNNNNDLDYDLDLDIDLDLDNDIDLGETTYCEALSWLS